jgi:hypothetical protein
MLSRTRRTRQSMSHGIQGESAKRHAAERWTLNAKRAVGLESYIGLRVGVGLISSTMYLAASVPNPYILLRQILDRMSPLDTTIFVLSTSFVGHLVAFVDPRS